MLLETENLYCRDHFNKDQNLNKTLSELDFEPRDTWPPVISPWDIFPRKKRKWKKTNDSIRRLSKEGKTKSLEGNSQKRLRGSFKFHSEIDEYIREYRNMRNLLASDFKCCSCHEPYYTLKDVENAYESMGNLPKRLTIKKKRSSEENDESRRKYQGQQGEQRVQQQTINFPENDFVSDSHQTGSTGGIPNGLDAIVDKCIDRHFFGLQQHLQNDFAKHEQSCHVVKIVIPEDQVITRISQASPSSSYSPKLPNCNGRESSSPFARPSSIFSHGTSSSLGTYSSKTTSSSASKVSAAVRDICPFPRSISTPRAPLLPGHSRRNNKQTFRKQSDNFNLSLKQAVPWKTLRYLGYNPTMRRYLHEIYTPVGRNNSGTPLTLSSKKCFPHGGDEKQTTDKQDKENNFFMPALQRSLVLRRNENAFQAFQSDRRTIPIDRPDKNKLPEHKPKLAILSACQTVVKPKVSAKRLVAS